jgi:penicillin-binding protein 1A
MLVIFGVGIPLFLLAAAGGGLALLLYGDLPGTVPEEHERLVSMPSTVVDAAGNPIGTFREFELTVPIEPDDIPQVMKDAVVAAEDQQFWEHEGVSPEALVRAAIENVREGEVVQGGSTITQQLVKNTYLTSERTVDRKLDEMILAARLEQEMTKEEILFAYLDSTYFGAGAYGVGAAAQTYFRKPVQELTASEAALLAGIIPAPSETGPRENPFGAEARRLLVLENMAELGSLTPDEYEAAKAEQLWFAPLGTPDRPATVYYPAEDEGVNPHPFFLDYVRQYLVERYGEDAVFRGGLRIETSLDPALQTQAEAAVAAGLEGTAAPLEMSLVSVDPATGQVKAFVGGRDWAASQVNLGLGGSLGMQPGSSFKPFVLATAFEQGMGPDDVMPAPGAWQVPGCEGSGCTINNYNGRGYGSMTLRSATWSSVNTVYGELIHELGPDSVAETARRLGVESLSEDREYGISLALGSAEVSPLEMAGAYAVFANHGLRADVTPVVRVTDAEGRVLEDHSVPGGEQVMHPAVADTVTDVLAGVVTNGTGTGAAIGRPAAGKTGTAEDYQAAWFVGYTPQLSTAVWMGYADDPRPLENIGGYGSVTGGSIPAATWAAFMEPAHENLPLVEFAEPGPLPAPGGGPAITPAPRDYPASPPLDCGGICASGGGGSGAGSDESDGGDAESDADDDDGDDDDGDDDDGDDDDGDAESDADEQTSRTTESTDDDTTDDTSTDAAPTNPTEQGDSDG